MNLYETLGVARTASEDEIKKAYNRLVLKYHPDRHKNKSEREMKEITEKFMKIKEAYDILSDKKKRAEYDKYGSVGNGYNFKDFNFNNFKDDNFKDGNFKYRNFYFGNFNFGNFDFSNFDFGNFGFGNFKNFTDFKNFKSTDPFEEIFSKSQQPSKYVLRLTLSELHTGCLRKVKIIRNRFGRREEKILDVKISPGEKNGTQFIFKGEGDENSANSFKYGLNNNFNNSFKNNDLIVIVEEIPDKIFKRKENDLEVKIRITFRDLIRGFSTPLSLPGGRVYNVTHRDVRKIGDWNVISGKGMAKKNGGVGDLKVFFTMDVPLMEDYKRSGMARYL
ncbi:DnaJ like protein subfamily B member 1 [Dictyocoela muelleri]|nr:DnaJ like protein subfamily B member 1 [Dictyocoela muelleri]